MTKKSIFLKPVAAAVGVAFVSTLLVSPTVLADSNPFSASDLDAGYQLAGDPDKAAEKDKEGMCGEGKCGADMTKDKQASDDADEHKGEKTSGDTDKEKGEEATCGADKEKGKEAACGGNA